MVDDGTAWRHLRNYESYEVIKQIYHAKHGRMPSTEHAREIASQFTQARNYFESAQLAETSIRPLLQYYGVIGLSRGLILFLRPKCREATLAQSHGLSSKDWSASLAIPSRGLGDLTVEVNKSGTLVELTSVVQNRSLLRWNSSGVNKKFSLGEVEAGSRYSLSELLCRTPDLVESLYHWKTPRCFKFEASQIDSNGSLNLTVRLDERFSFTEADLLAIFAKDSPDMVSSSSRDAVLKFKSSTISSVIVSDQISDGVFGIGDSWMASAYPSGGSLCAISQLFTISFIMGTLARYHPSTWMAFLQRRYSDASGPVVFQAIELVQKRFPIMIVDFLNEKD